MPGEDAAVFAYILCWEEGCVSGVGFFFFGTLL